MGLVLGICMSQREDGSAEGTWRGVGGWVARWWHPCIGHWLLTPASLLLLAGIRWVRLLFLHWQWAQARCKLQNRDGLDCSHALLDAEPSPLAPGRSSEYHGHATSLSGVIDHSPGAGQATTLLMVLSYVWTWLDSQPRSCVAWNAGLFMTVSYSLVS